MTQGVGPEPPCSADAAADIVAASANALEDAVGASQVGAYTSDVCDAVDVLIGSASVVVQFLSSTEIEQFAPCGSEPIAGDANHGASNVCAAAALFDCSALET
ncbi:MAG: hypothetical protein ABSC87_05545 [Halobacteriota archaeon]